LFGGIRNGKLAGQIVPILEFGLAQTVFHEFGHHKQHTRSHGVKKSTRENFADSYAKRLIKSYILTSADLINACFDRIQLLPESRGIPGEKIEALRAIRARWQAEYQEAVKP